jgi:hypothetical protein
VAANAVFAQPAFRPVGGHVDDFGPNVTGAHREASDHMVAPFAPLGRLNLKPKPGQLELDADLPPEILVRLPGVGRDFDGYSRSGKFAGGYTTPPSQPRWLPSSEIKPDLELRGKAEPESPK